MNIAPIVLFTYNRLEHTKKTVYALQKNTLAKESDLIIFSDGPKDSIKSQESVLELRKYLKTITGFKNIKIIEREKNYGLANSIIDGVTKIINEFGKIIVLEDDLITAPTFLKYMNEALDLYEKDEEVISIHGYIYPTKETLPNTFFIKGADCWGWATWKRGWNMFDTDGKKLLEELKNKKLTKEFDLSGSYPYTKMLEDQIGGKNNSWAIRWYASAFLKNKLTLYPGKSLVQNTGFDSSGTHCSNETDFNNINKIDNVEIKIEKIKTEENKIARSLIVKYFKNRNSVMKKITKLKLFNKIKKYILKQSFSPDFFGVFLNPFYFARLGLYKNIRELSHFISGDILDVGCGQKPYQYLFSFNKYIGMDVKQSGHNHTNENIEVYYDGNKFPLENNSFDSVISNEVFEHVFNPQEHLSEIYRVLKPGGKVLMTVPFLWDEHEQPYDFARYSSFGLKHLFENNGFKIIEQKKSIPDIRVIFQIINIYLYKKTTWCRKGILLNYFFTFIINSPFNILGEIANLIFPKNNDLYIDNVIVAVKNI